MKDKYGKKIKIGDTIYFDYSFDTFVVVSFEDFINNLLDYCGSYQNDRVYCLGELGYQWDYAENAVRIDDI